MAIYGMLSMAIHDMYTLIAINGIKVSKNTCTTKKQGAGIDM